jgi:DNA-binding PadR family transcriptional regulator
MRYKSNNERYMSTRSKGPSTLEYHVLLALANGPLYGYAVKSAVEAESVGVLAPRAGSLYRLLARLVSRGLVTETEPQQTVEPHPGLARRYYGLTVEGRAALAAEARRLRSVAALAARRLGTAGDRS